MEGRLTWTCHICGSTRPDEKISVLSKPLIVGGVSMMGEQNIRYCNDRQKCIDGAKDFSFFKEVRGMTETMFINPERD